MGMIGGLRHRVSFLVGGTTHHPQDHDEDDEDDYRERPEYELFHYHSKKINDALEQVSQGKAHDLV